MLDLERQYYAENVEAWKRDFPGKFVVVKGKELVGAYPTMEEALVAGASRFRLDPFLVRLVGEGEKEVSVPALTLGLLSANPAYTDHESGPSA